MPNREWWGARSVHNDNIGYIPAAYVKPFVSKVNSFSVKLTCNAYVIHLLVKLTIFLVKLTCNAYVIHL